MYFLKLPRHTLFYKIPSNNEVYTSLYSIQCRFAKITRWLADTSHAHSMEKLTHFNDLVNYCLDNKDDFGKRDIIASLSYMKLLKNFSLSCRKFIEYSDFICNNLNMFGSSVHLLIHRYAILGYNPALITIYERFIKNNINKLDNKSLSLIAWGYAKSNVYIHQLFDGIANQILSRDSTLYLTDISLLLWSFAKTERRVPHEIMRLKNDLFKVLDSIKTSLSTNGKEVNDISKDYLDKDCTFYSNVVHDISMAVKALSVLLPRDRVSITQTLEILFDITKLGNLPLTAQGITSIWECLQNSNVKDETILENLCEVSRYLRLDHSFNSNMLNTIVTSIHKLGVNDPRIIYQIVHWIEKRCTQMRAPQMYNTIYLLDQMNVYHEKAWKQLGVIVQRKAIDLELGEIKHLYNIFKRNGKGNDRIFGILEHFISCKHDIEQYGPT